jgi:hypothetical protein
MLRTLASAFLEGNKLETIVPHACEILVGMRFKYIVANTERMRQYFGTTGHIQLRHLLTVRTSTCLLVNR